MIVRYKAGHEDQAILDDIADRIDRNMVPWYGASCRLVSGVPEFRSYTNSFLLRYEVATPGGRQAVLAKIRRAPKMESLSQATQARDLHTNIPDEYHAMQFVYENIGGNHANFTAIRPLAFFEEYHAIVMEEFPSRSLRRLLEKNETHERMRNRLQVVQDAACKAGELLRFFHDKVQSTTECPLHTEQIIADIESYTMRLERCSDGHIQSRSLLNEFGQRLAGREIRSIPFTGIHQDLTCDNVLYSENGKVCLIDIKTRPGPIYSDMALLLIHPETFRSQIFRTGIHFSDSFLQSYRTAILAGYFAQDRIDYFLIHLFCAIRVLDKWTMHAELLHRYTGFKRAATRPLVPIVNRYFDSLLKRYLRAAR